MGIKRQIARNIERQNQKELEKQSKYLRKGWNNMSMSDKNLLVNLARNGITVEDVKREISDTKKRTHENTAIAVMKVVYAAMALTLIDEFHFSKEDCFKAISAVDQRMAVLIDYEDVIAEMEQKAGIRFHSDNGVERVEMI